MVFMRIEYTVEWAWNLSCLLDTRILRGVNSFRIFDCEY